MKNSNITTAAPQVIPSAMRPALPDDFLCALKTLIANCGSTCGKQDQARTAIAACIAEGIVQGSSIVQALHHVGFNSQYVGMTLKHFAGSDPARHDWYKDEKGLYRLHDYPTASL